MNDMMRTLLGMPVNKKLSEVVAYPANNIAKTSRKW